MHFHRVLQFYVLMHPAKYSNPWNTNTVLPNNSHMFQLCRPSSEKSVQCMVVSLQMDEDAETCSSWRTTNVLLIYEFMYVVGGIIKLDI